jgi:hypothetical protein
MLYFCKKCYSKIFTFWEPYGINGNFVALGSIASELFNQYSIKYGKQLHTYIGSGTSITVSWFDLTKIRDCDDSTGKALFRSSTVT